MLTIIILITPDLPLSFAPRQTLKRYLTLRKIRPPPRPLKTTNSRTLKPSPNQPLKHLVRIIPPLHLSQPPYARRAITPNHILVITRIIHEPILEIHAFFSCRRRDTVDDRACCSVHRLIAVRAPPAGVEHEPGLVHGLQAERIGAEHGARGDGLHAQREGSGGDGADGLQFRRGDDDVGDFLVERGAAWFEACGEPVPSVWNLD